jgi:hypothetical protein
VVDTYEVRVNPDAPGYVGEIRVAAFVAGPEIRYLDLPDGAPSLSLGDFRVVRAAPPGYMANDPAFTPIEATFREGEKTIRLRDFRWNLGAAEPGDDSQKNPRRCLHLRWEAVNDGLPELAVMRHLQDGAGQIAAFEDSAPADDLYPTHLWRAGQIVDDVRCFTMPEGVQSVLVGLYGRSGGARWAVFGPSGARPGGDTVVIMLR